jgi:hypothetical protein
MKVRGVEKAKLPASEGVKVWNTKAEGATLLNAVTR